MTDQQELLAHYASGYEAERVEAEPTLLGLSAHLFGVGVRAAR
jgi:hypothetical protein